MSENLEFQKKILTTTEKQNFQDLLEREVFRIDQLLGIESRRQLIVVGLRKVLSDKYETDEAKALGLKEGQLHLKKKINLETSSDLQKGLETIRKDRPDLFKKVMNILKNDL